MLKHDVYRIHIFLVYITSNQITYVLSYDYCNSRSSLKLASWICMFFLASWIVVVFCWSKGTVLSLLIVLLLFSVCCCLAFVVCCFPCFPCLFACFLVGSYCLFVMLVCFHHGLSIQNFAKPQGRGAFKDHRLGQKKPEESIRKTHAVQVP